MFRGAGHDFLQNEAGIKREAMVSGARSTDYKRARKNGREMLFIWHERKAHFLPNEFVSIHGISGIRERYPLLDLDKHASF